MKKMTRRTFMKSAAVAGLAASSIGFPAVLRKAHAAPVTLKFGTYEPAHSFNSSKVFIPWIEKVNAAGKGVIEIKFFPNGALGADVMQQLKMIVGGIADITVTSLNWTPGRFPQANVVNTPLFARNMLEASMAVFSMWEKGIFSGFEDIHPLTMNAQPQYYFHTNYPARLPKDLNGHKINAASRLMAALVSSCGATPVAEGIAKIAENISRGLLEGCVAEWNGMQSFRMIDVTNCHITVPLGANCFPVLINKRKLDSLPAPARDILLEHSGWVFTEFFAKSWDNYNADIEKSVRANPKHTVIDPTEEDLKIWADTFKPAVDAWMATQPENIKIAELYKEEIAKARAKLGTAT